MEITIEPKTHTTDRHNSIIGQEHEGKRLDTYLTRALADHSRTWLQERINCGDVTINGAVASKSSYRLKCGDKVTLVIPLMHPTPVPICTTNSLGIKLIYTHDHFLILEKPAGIMVHRPTKLSQAITITEWLTSSFADIATVGNVERPGIVHRLDQDTSGLLIVARTNMGHITLSEMFKQREIHKTYLAIVHGHPPAQGTIDLPIGRHPVHRHRMTAFAPHDKRSSHATIRAAVTHYKVVTYFRDHALIQAMPVTGRTHQIRVHMAALGTPIIGDPLYNSKKTNLIKRHALHAHKLTFAFQGKNLTFESPAPEDFSAALARLERDEKI